MNEVFAAGRRARAYGAKKGANPYRNAAVLAATSDVGVIRSLGELAQVWEAGWEAQDEAAVAVGSQLSAASHLWKEIGVGAERTLH